MIYRILNNMRQVAPRGLNPGSCQMQLPVFFCLRRRSLETCQASLGTAYWHNDAAERIAHTSRQADGDPITCDRLMAPEEEASRVRGGGEDKSPAPVFNADSCRNR